MAGTRKVTYASVADLNGGKTVYSSAENKGQLFSEYPELELLSKGMKPWVKKANDPSDKGYGLSSSDSSLPEGDIQIYFLVDKNDSGS